MMPLQCNRKLEAKQLSAKLNSKDRSRFFSSNQIKEGGHGVMIKTHFTFDTVQSIVSQGNGLAVFNNRDRKALGSFYY